MSTGLRNCWGCGAAIPRGEGHRYKRTGAPDEANHPRGDYCSRACLRRSQGWWRVAAEDRAATVHLYGEARVQELEQEANRG